MFCHLDDSHLAVLDFPYDLICILGTYASENPKKGEEKNRLPLLPPLAHLSVRAGQWNVTMKSIDEFAIGISYSKSSVRQMYPFLVLRHRAS